MRGGWPNISYSNNPQGSCVEVLLTGHAAAVRDSKNADGPAITLATRSWAVFVTSLTS
ncbi:MAG TPA: DUF397 domain-containing protein [Actinokineospora sp.]|nr:DUF397 domain-containing protein [Actinokineospora sp.]